MSRRPETIGARSVPALLVDTSAFYALADESDEYHPSAKALFQDLTKGGLQLVTTTFILAETHALILARTGRADKALGFLTSIYGSRYTTLIRPTEADEQRALAILATYHDKQFSFTDALSFTVMERLHLTDTFTFDHHFTQYGAQYGWTILRPGQR